MESLLDLDQIIIDEIKKQERIKLLYGLCHGIYTEMTRWGSSESESSKALMKQYDKYMNELRSYGCDV